MECRIEILKKGLLCSIQDLGRTGMRNQAISKSGVLDQNAYQNANLLVGNNAGEAVIECHHLAPTLQVHANAVVAFTGADMQWTINGLNVSTNQTHRILAGDTISGSVARDGVHAYIGIGGIWQIEQIHRSKSTNLVTGFGGHKGRALQKGDSFVVDTHEFESPIIGMDSNINTGKEKTIKFHEGPEWSLFTEDEQKAFSSSVFSKNTKSNRVGSNLDGLTNDNANTVLNSSSVVFPGIVQWPYGSGPIVLLNDCQTTGGYPRMAILEAEELWKFVQFCLNEKFGFVLK